MTTRDNIRSGHSAGAGIANLLKDRRNQKPTRRPAKTPGSDIDRESPSATAGQPVTLPGNLPDGAVAEYRFHPTRKFRFDWAWPAAKVAMEIEGGIYGRGKKCKTCGRRGVAGHTSVERLKTDMEKYTSAAILGWRLLRVTPAQFNSGEAGRLVRLALEATA